MNEKLILAGDIVEYRGHSCIVDCISEESAEYFILLSKKDSPLVGLWVRKRHIKFLRRPSINILGVLKHLIEEGGDEKLLRSLQQTI